MVDAENALSLAELRGDVIFKDVHFSYEPETPVLKGVSLHAKPGEIVALVGPTGAGKTTIVNLLTRFYDIDSGQIIIDGHDLRQLHRHDLRRQLGIVLQDTFLFADSVMENIRYGRLAASDDEVIAAATLANADQFIHRLPQGYDTPLSERGSNLSQGQRQLWAIARHPGQPAHLDSRRSHQQRRYAHRAAHPGGHAAAHGRAHQLCHRPPPQHHPQRRSDFGDQPRRNYRARHA
ncbi:MAG: ATP-binding cassette domain-containing protein [Caldilineaceae bacterium]